jgi:2-deoxy-D-gluconate 3-dehydrogenase
LTVLDSFRLGGRVALVTGAARGLGQGIAIGLGEAGADIVALDVLPLDETRELVSAIGRKFCPLNFDLREANAELAAKIIDKIVSEMGRLDILVNNAGIIRRAPALEFREEDWEDVVTHLTQGPSPPSGGRILCSSR